MARLALCIALIALHYATAFILPACTLNSRAVAKTSASVRRAAAPSELLQPPDRANINIEEEAEFNFDDINAFPSHMPRPPFHIQVPGEQGESTLCTDPDWCTVMLALKFLGLPFEVEKAKEHAVRVHELNASLHICVATVSRRCAALATHGRHSVHRLQHYHLNTGRALRAE
eukprot:2763-Heterococcus_DN1.PRE.1